MTWVISPTNRKVSLDEQTARDLVIFAFYKYTVPLEAHTWYSELVDSFRSFYPFPNTKDLLRQRKALGIGLNENSIPRDELLRLYQHHTNSNEPWGDYPLPTPTTPTPSTGFSAFMKATT